MIQESAYTMPLTQTFIKGEEESLIADAAIQMENFQRCNSLSDHYYQIGGRQIYLDGTTLLKIRIILSRDPFKINNISSKLFLISNADENNELLVRVLISAQHHSLILTYISPDFGHEKIDLLMGRILFQETSSSAQEENPKNDSSNKKTGKGCAIS